ncbi:MAG: hypothetical protein ACJARM_001662 [Glaciecola sp.]|jgi:hypothetical protein
MNVRKGSEAASQVQMNLKQYNGFERAYVVTMIQFRIPLHLLLLLFDDIKV